MQEELTARQARWAAGLVAGAFPALIQGWDLVCVAIEPWGAGEPPPVVGVLVTVQELAIGGIAALALVLLLATFRRTVSPRRVTALAAVLGAAAVAVCSSTGVAMNLVNATGSDNVLVLHPLGPPVLIASIALFVLVLRTTAHSLRVARCAG